jgi:ubiquinone/menaquinone biosynthesis C-methylase UbiE
LNPFERGPAAAAAYDAWYASLVGQRVLEAEALCVSAVLAEAGRPWVEVGCGSGRVGQAVGVELGIDPAAELLRLAHARLPNVARGVAERLPLADASIGAVMAVAVVEFLVDPPVALREIRRVLVPGGLFALGFLPAAGPWANRYRLDADRGDELFREAHFYTSDELSALARAEGFGVCTIRSALFEPPEVIPSLRVETAPLPNAGFVVLGLQALR